MVAINFSGYKNVGSTSLQTQELNAPDSYTEGPKQITTRLENDRFEKNSNQISRTISKKEFIPLSFDVNYNKPHFINDNYEMRGGIYDLKVENNLSGRSINGEISGKKVNFKISNSFWNLDKGELSGQIDGKNINLKFVKLDNGDYNLIGKADRQIQEFLPAVTLLISDERNYNEQQAELMTGVMMGQNMGK